MKTILRAAAVLVLLSVLLVWADDKKKGPNYYVKPNQIAELEDSHVVTARQKCENWAMAAGLESMLQRRNVNFDQNFWVARISGSDICVPSVPAVEAVSKAVNGEFVLSDGRHVLLELLYTPGVPTSVDPLIMGLKQRRLSLLVLRGHVYYLTGVTYDEYINNDGTRLFVVTELRLANTFAGQPSAVFTRGKDNLDEITGVITVNVTWP